MDTADQTIRAKPMGQSLVVQSSRAVCTPTGTPVVVAFVGQSRVRGM